MTTVANADEMFYLTVKMLAEDGAPLESRDGPCHESIGYQMALRDPTDNFVTAPERNLSPIYVAGEMLWYLSGSKDGKQICHYAPQYARFLRDDGTAFGAYGARWKACDQIRTVIGLLQDQPNTRQAVVAQWFPSDLVAARFKAEKDLPCTLTLKFYVRQGTLHMITDMRSNDAWLGLPNDVFCFTTLQILIAGFLGVRVGYYYHQAGSMHYYERNSVGIDKVAAALTEKIQERTAVSERKPNKLDDLITACEIERDVRLGIIPTPFLRLGDAGMSGTVLGQLVALAAMQTMSMDDIRKTIDLFSATVHPCLLWRAMAHKERQTQKAVKP